MINENVGFQTYILNLWILSIDPTDLISDDPHHKAFEAIYGKNSIHSPQAIKYYKDILKADTYVLSICQHGLLLPFNKEPGEYQEPNNRSPTKTKTWCGTRF